MNRTPLRSLVSAFILLAPTACFAQGNSSDTTGADGSNIQQSGGRQLHIGEDAKVADDNTLITGRCVMLKTGDNPIGGYCADVALTLFDESGKTVGQLRTDRRGNFKINVDDPNAKYHFGPSSAAYEVQGPNKPVQGGGHALLKLKFKKS